MKLWSDIMVSIVVSAVEPAVFDAGITKIVYEILKDEGVKADAKCQDFLGNNNDARYDLLTTPIASYLRALADPSFDKSSFYSFMSRTPDALFFAVHKYINSSDLLNYVHPERDNKEVLCI